MARKTDSDKWQRRDRKRVKQSGRDMVVTNASVKLLDKLQRERAKRGGK